MKHSTPLPALFTRLYELVPCARNRIIPGKQICRIVDLLQRNQCGKLAGRIPRRRPLIPMGKVDVNLETASTTDLLEPTAQLDSVIAQDSYLFWRGVEGQDLTILGFRVQAQCAGQQYTVRAGVHDLHENCRVAVWECRGSIRVLGKAIR